MFFSFNRGANSWKEGVPFFSWCGEHWVWFKGKKYMFPCALKLKHKTWFILLRCYSGTVCIIALVTFIFLTCGDAINVLSPWRKAQNIFIKRIARKYLHVTSWHNAQCRNAQHHAEFVHLAHVGCRGPILCCAKRTPNISPNMINSFQFDLCNQDIFQLQTVPGMSFK
jgi:hypothetical protein